MMVRKPTSLNFVESALGVGFGGWLIFTGFRPTGGWIMLALGVIGFALKWRAFRD